MSLKTGPMAFLFPADSQVEILCESAVTVFAVDEDGAPEKLVARSRDGRLRFRVREEFGGYVSVPSMEHWAMDVTPIPSASEPADPKPVEVPEDKRKALSLEDRLQAMLAAMVAERFGADSDEMAILEEEMDFEWDEHDPLSGYEVTEADEVHEPEEPDGDPEPHPAGDKEKPPAATAGAE